MLADQFLEAVAAARTGAATDEVSRLLWRAHAERQISDADAEAISKAMQSRRAALSGQVSERGRAEPRPKTVLGAPRASRRASRSCPREKMFGLGRPRALDRNAKVRIMHWARCLSRRTEKGRAYGAVTAKALAVLEALLWGFHNAKSGLCFPLRADRRGRRLRPLDRRGGAQGPRGRRDHDLGPAGQAGARALRRSAGRQRMALARVEDVERLQLPRPRIARSFQVRKADWNTKSRLSFLQ